MGAPRPLWEAGLDAAEERFGAAAWVGSGGGMYGGPVSHAEIWWTSLEPQPAATKQAVEKGGPRAGARALSMALRAMTHIRPEQGLGAPWLGHL